MTSYQGHLLFGRTPVGVIVGDAKPQDFVLQMIELYRQGHFPFDRLIRALQLTGDDVCFMPSTLGHITGFYWGMLLPLSMGQKVVYQDAWDARWLIDLIDAEKITWTLSATPFAIDMIEAQQDTKRSLASFRAFACGGAPIPPQIATRIQERLGVDLVSLWGATEVGICTIHSLGTPVEVVANSDGAPVGWMELRIVDEELNPVEPYQEGRLQVRGPSVLVGYLNQPELIADIQTCDGWFDTGDLGRATRDGGIRVSGRSKDIIVRGGQNVPVVEVENELLKHPNIREVVVVGVPDPRLGERGCAVTRRPEEALGGRRHGQAVLAGTS
jgi:cyclohexanecarboxylate-CoA ligase